MNPIDTRVDKRLEDAGVTHNDLLLLQEGLRGVAPTTQATSTGEIKTPIPFEIKTETQTFSRSNVIPPTKTQEGSWPNGGSSALPELTIYLNVSGTATPYTIFGYPQ